MKIHTLTAVVGGKACNASCPYCVSKMTPDCGVTDRAQKVNWRNFRKACQFAKDCGVSTLLLTGKGEPTLWPSLVEGYIQVGDLFNIPFIELQTNGIELATNKATASKHLKSWHKKGLSTVSISVAHYFATESAEIMSPNRPYNFWIAVDRIHEAGLSVRINCTCFDGGVYDKHDITRLIEECKERGVEQITIRNVTLPEMRRNKEIYEWVAENRMTDKSFERMVFELIGELGGVQLLRLPHGAVVWDVRGQNICLSRCLTSSVDSEDMRQLIFFPDGHLRFDWKYEGAIIL